MKVIFDKGLYKCRPEKEFIPALRKSKWGYHKPSNTWRTSQTRRVIPFYQYCSPIAKSRVGKLIKEKQDAIRPSVAEELDFDFTVPCPEGEAYRPFQVAGIHYMAQRSVTLLGDSPGLGKTIQAIGLFNLRPKARKILIVCPASLKRMWGDMLDLWDVHKRSWGIVDGNDYPEDVEIVIINYDILDRHTELLYAKQWDIMIIDEGHYLQHSESGRTQAAYGETRRGKSSMERRRKQGIQADATVVMTGTPIRTCPHNLWPFLSRFDPDGLGRNYFAFISRYCGWTQGETLPPRGGSNLDELQEYLRTKLMIRRNKMSVLKELPPKTNQIVSLPAKGLKKLVAAEESAIRAALGDLEAMLEEHEEDIWKKEEEGGEEDYASYLGVFTELSGDDFIAQAEKMGEGEKTPFEMMAEARKNLAIAKVPMCVEFIKNVMAGSEEKTIVFAFHKDVVSELEKHFPNSVSIVGKTPVKKRQDIVKEFQNNPDIDPIIGNITAMGVGYTLTAATNVIFVELSWVPADMEQASDRPHRIGQLNAVNVWHLVVDGSMDSKMIEKLVERMQMIAEALDRPENDVLDIVL